MSQFIQDGSLFMRNLFDNLTNSLGQFTQQGQQQNRGNNSSGNRGNGANGSGWGQIGAMGVGGLLGALLDNPKNISRNIKKAAMIGGGAALGGLAYSMYQKWRNNSQSNQNYQQPYAQGGQQPNYNAGGFNPQQGGFNPYQGSYNHQQGGFGGMGQMGNGGFNQGGSYSEQSQVGYRQASGMQHPQQVGYQAPSSRPFPKQAEPVANADPFAAYNEQNQSTAPQVDTDAVSDLLLEAMVFAARADNHIDANEKQMIMKVAQELNPSQNLMNKITEFLNEPLDPNILARKITNPEMASDLYRLSAAAIVADTSVERQYLQSLARALNLSAQQVAILDREAEQFRQQASMQ